MAITGNGIELLVKLGVNNGESKANINAEIATLQKQLNDVKIDIKIDPQAIKSINQLATMDFSKLIQSANEVKAAMKDVGTSAKSTAKMTEAEFKQSGKDIETAFKHLGTHFNKEVKQGIKADVQDLRQAFKGLQDVSFKMDYKMVDNAGANTAVRQIDAVTVSYRNLQGQMEKMKMNKINIGTDTGTRPVFVPSLDNTAVDKSIAAATRLGQTTQAQLIKMRSEGKLTEKQFQELSVAMERAGKGLNSNTIAANQSRLNQRIQEAVQSNKQITAAQKETEASQKRLIDNENKRKNLVIDIQRAMKTQGKDYDHAGAQRLLTQTQALNTSSKQFGQTIATNRIALRQMSADASQASQQSMSVVSAFQQAMLKFPMELFR